MIRRDRVCERDGEGRDLSGDRCCLVDKSKIKDRGVSSVLMAPPCRNARWVQKLKTLVVKPVYKICGPGRYRSGR